jgi:hypothetical protein
MAENGSTDTPRRRQAKRPRLDFDQDDSSFRNTNHDPIPSTSTALTSAWQFGTLETNSFDFAGSGSLLLSATSHNLPRQQLPPPIKCGSCLRLLNSGASALPGTYIFCPRFASHVRLLFQCSHTLITPPEIDVSFQPVKSALEHVTQHPHHHLLQHRCYRTRPHRHVRHSYDR